MKKYLPLIVLLTGTLLAYGQSVKYGFSQDDFFHITIARMASVKDVFAVFIPHPTEWIFYRPLSTELWYGLFLSLFGWAHAALPMHIASLCLHTVNAYLVYRVFQRFLRANQVTALAAGFLYAIAGVHFLSLFYIGATQQIMMTFFGLTTLLLNGHGNQREANITFICSLLAKELALRFIPFAIMLYLLRGTSLKEAIKKTSGLIVIGIAYVIFRLAFGLGSAPEYELNFSFLTTAATTMWYAVMSLGAPENILRYGLSAGHINFRAFIADNGLLGLINTTAVAAVAFFSLLRLRKNAVYLAGAWVAGIVVVLFLPTHRYAHYLDISLIPLLYLLLGEQKSVIKQSVIIGLITIASFTSIAIDQKTHWTVGRAVQAAEYRARIVGEHVCDHKELAFTGSTSDVAQLSYSLMYANGPRVICSNPKLDVIYVTPEDLAKQMREHTISEDTAVIDVGLNNK